MAFSVGLALALGKAASGIAKGIKGHMQTKNAGSAGLVDPTQTAMVNLMHRERRAMATGTSDAGARNSLAKDSKNLTRRSILGGKRDLGDYTKFRAANEAAITEARAGERLGMLKNLTEETRNQADRSMDLVELEGERQRTYGQAAKQTASKNFMSQVPALQEALQTKSDNMVAAKSNQAVDDPLNPKKKKFTGELLNKIGGAIKGVFSEEGATAAAEQGAN